MAEYKYNEFIKEQINLMDTSTNVLEAYDNVTYNMSLYMYDFETQREIDSKLSTYEFDPDNYVNKRYIIAQTGLTTNFVLNSLTLKSVYGNINSPMNVATYQGNIKLFEPMGANFTNAVDVVSELLGYKSHLFRPYWLDIWFSGYNSAGEPVERIEFENKLKTITLEGNFGNVKSQIDRNGTTWNIDFIPNYNSLINKDNNHLTITSSMKDSANGKFTDFLQRCVETMEDDYISQFKKSDRKAVKRLIDTSESYDFDMNDDSSEYIKISIKEKDGTSLKDFNKEEEILEDTSNDDTTVNAREVKESPKEYFTTFVQDLLSRTKRYNKHVARFDIKPMLKGYVNNVPVFSYKMTVILFKDPVIEKALEDYNNNQTVSDNTEAAKKYFSESIADGSLRKRYLFGFSGIDTSVLQIYNNYDMLWYMNDVSDSILKYKEANINLMRSKTKEDNNKDSRSNSPKSLSAHILDSLLNASSNTSNLDDNKYKLVEDLFYNNYEKIKDLEINCKAPLVSGNLTQVSQNSMVSSSKKEEDAIAIASKTLFERLYKSGQISTTKFQILGDPYWISINSMGACSSNIRDKNLFYKMPNVCNYKCVFQLKTFFTQVLNYDKAPTDYDVSSDSLNVTGIYLIYDCESKFEDGKFTQTLTGVFDPHFLDIN